MTRFRIWDLGFRKFGRLLALAMFLALAAPAFPADPVDEALERGVKFLLTQQTPEGIITVKGRRNETAMTSLAVLAIRTAPSSNPNLA